MRTRGDIKTKLKPKLYAVGTSTYFTETRIDSSIDDNYLLVASAKPWGEVKKGFVTNTIANEDYYDYPDNCQTGSVFKISVDNDSDYDKWDFEDFLKEREDNPNSTEKIFSEYGRQLFIFPTPTTTGSANLILWGVMQATSLNNDGDVTIFTDWADILNEAILQYTYADMVQNLDPKASELAIAKGDKIINSEYKKIADRLQRKLKDRPQFEVPDFYKNNMANIGQFSVTID